MPVSTTKHLLTLGNLNCNSVVPAHKKHRVPTTKAKRLMQYVNYTYKISDCHIWEIRLNKQIRRIFRSQKVWGSRLLYLISNMSLQIAAKELQNTSTLQRAQQTGYSRWMTTTNPHAVKGETARPENSLPGKNKICKLTYLISFYFIFLSDALQPKIGPRPCRFEVSRSDSIGHMPDRIPLNEHSASRRGRYLHNTQQK